MKTSAAALSALVFAFAAAVTDAAPPASPAAAPQPPAPNWYNVEMIVFRSVDPAAGGGETWPADPGTPDWAGALPLNPPNSIGPAVPYQALSPVNEQLDEDWTRLKRSHDYQPLVHVTWVQPALDRATAPWVRIGVPPSAVPTAATVAAPAATTGTAPLQATLAYGSARLSTTGQYLHFDLDIALQGPVARSSWPAPGISAATMTASGAAPAVAAPAFQLYRLRQDRRVNAGKLNYFDNPLLGAIVLITPTRRP
ncbi:MAG TPA: CsiV family protein [Gammaproteobacteria bacterium]|nr:CsiV family protein [Gammaproteobacteria bacterium]